MTFVPPFCPNKHCSTHRESLPFDQLWYLRKGFRPTKVVGPVPRFQCRLCGKGFSQRTFDIDYWVHRPVDYRLVQNLLVGGSGLRQACRTMGVSTRLLANRHFRLARQSLALHSQCLDGFRLQEALVFDGFESFTFSQYYPSNLNLLVTSDSQFVLGLNATILRRKGKMTEDQKKRRTSLETKWRASPSAITNSSKELLTYGCHLSFGAGTVPIVIRTDEKKEYARALRHNPFYGPWIEEGLLVHSTISSKASRTRHNPLFPVNYLDRQLRKDLAEHVRETVRFARRIEHSLERAMIHLAHHNYFKSFRSRFPDKGLTHAQEAGLDREEVKILRDRALKERAFGWRFDLERWQLSLWRRTTSIPVHPVTPLAAHLMTA